MSAVRVIAGRELRAFFLTPGGYVIAALYMLVNGWRGQLREPLGCGLWPGYVFPRC